jgi:hypothetical protein
VLLVDVVLNLLLLLVVIVKTNHIDYKTPQLVLVWMDIMKPQNSSVNIVMLNVKLVKVIKLIVSSVLESEKVLQNVSAHMDSMLMKTVSVNNVVQNVPNVKFLLITVLNVLLKDNQVLKTLLQFLAHVSMVSSKRMTIVTNVDTNVSLVKEAKKNV